MLVDDRHVERVGTGDPPTADRIVDLPGTTILPGFVDAHVHLTGTGVHLAAPQAAAASTAEELVEAARVIAAERSGPTLIHGFDESGWAERLLPPIEALDRASELPLAIVRADGHLSLANRAALKASGVLGRDGVELDADGEPTGAVRVQANAALQHWFHERLGDADVEALQLEAASLAASRGVTCVHEMSIPLERGFRDVEVLLRHRRRLPVDVVVYVATTEIGRVMDLGLSTIGGDLSLDGSLGARTAHLSEPYADGEGSGVGYLGDDELVEFLHDAHLAGMQVAVHAIGDRAIEQIVSAWERVYQALDSRARRHFRARRHRVEHFVLAGQRQMERAAMLGLGISVQPAFDALWGSAGALYEQRLGPDRAAEANRFRTFVERGLEVGAGSDSPVTELDPMTCVAALEEHHDPAQRLSREEALRLTIQGGARLAHLEEKKGQLEPGAHADFAVYEVDLSTARDLRGLRPILTVSLGREVFAV